MTDAEAVKVLTKARRMYLLRTKTNSSPWVCDMCRSRAEALDVALGALQARISTEGES